MGTEVYVRKASGLVRTVSTLDVLLFNLIVVNFGYLFVLTVGWSAWQAPGANLPIAALLLTLLMIPQSIVFVILSTVMPRSGGDYVYVSRILHPALGFLSNWIMVLTGMGIMCIGFIANWAFSILGYAGLLGVGVATNNTSLMHIAELMGTDPNWIFVGSLLLILFFTIVHILGTKAYFYVQRILFILGMIGIVIALGVLAAATHEQFVSSFNSFMITRGFSTAANPYQAIIDQAAKEGLSYIDWLPATFLAMLATYWSMITSMSSVWFAGEIKRVERSQLIGVLGSVIICGLFTVISALLLTNICGYDFLCASGYLFFRGTSPFPYPTYPTTWLAFLTDNVVLQSLMAIGWFAWGIACLGVWWLIITRSWFAWGFDRIAPSWFADVNPRFHTPTKAIVLASVVGIIFLAQYTYPPTNTFWATTPLFALLLVPYVLVGISAIILPWKKKDLYEASPIKKYHVGPIPLISILGAIMVGFNLAVMYMHLTWPWFGWTDAATYFSIGVIITAFIWFYAFRYYRKKQGIDVGLAYREIPPD